LISLLNDFDVYVARIRCALVGAVYVKSLRRMLPKKQVSSTTVHSEDKSESASGGVGADKGGSSAGGKEGKKKGDGGKEKSKEKSKEKDSAAGSGEITNLMSSDTDKILVSSE
jgi:hypothetical protein